jgi:hypothetical protein
MRIDGTTTPLAFQPAFVIDNAGNVRNFGADNLYLSTH